jgi:hypothetical protein|tara:strand:- start:789 stop:1577 length:789 start_codon:yes stop_codon:yes gene_type:complete
MIEDLKSFWSNYNPYKLHPEDENYLNQNKQKYCLEISIEELRIKYGNDLKSDLTREKFVNDKNNKNKILINLRAGPFFGDVTNAKIYILMGNPGFHTGDYVDEIEDENNIHLLNANLNLELKTFGCLHDKAIKTGGYRYWSNKGRIPKISKILTSINKQSSIKNYQLVKDSICVVESIAYHSCNKPNDELYNLPSSKLTKRLVNDYIQERVNNDKAMCFVWRSAAFWNMNSHKNLLIRDPKQAQLAVFKNDEAEVMAKFLNN